MKFSYLKAGLWKRPIIPVTIRYKQKEVSYLVLLDSGADFNILHNDMANVLDIDLSKQIPTKFSGIKEGAEASGKFSEVELSIDGKNYFKAMVMFSKDISPNGYGILGQQGFFNKFSVNFDYLKNLIEIL